MSPQLPVEAWATALAALPHFTPLRLLAVLNRMPPEDAWRAAERGVELVAGIGRNKLPVTHSLQEQARRVDPERLWDRCMQLGIRVLLRNDPAYPAALAADPFGPAVLFCLGSLDLVSHRTVAIVGTRRATASGRGIATEFGEVLARHDVAVVSGLALGIDGAAHRGALRVSPGRAIGVVGCGLDVVYPKAHNDLWWQVAERGLLMSEVPPGIAPLPYRFPARNRIIATLAEAVVVVESRERGGSLLTADEALARQRLVLVVPGSIRNPAAVGTNMLIAEGATAVTSIEDVLAMIGLDTLALPSVRDPRPRPSGMGVELLGHFDGAARSLDELVALTKCSLAEVALVVGHLEMAGWLVRTGGLFELVHPASVRRAVP